MVCSRANRISDFSQPAVFTGGNILHTSLQLYCREEENVDVGVRNIILRRFKLNTVREIENYIRLFLSLFLF